MFIKVQNAIYLEDANGQEGRSFKSRFLQAGLVKYDFGVCLLKKETIDKFVNTFMECPVIIGHKDDITENDVVGTIQKIWFSSDDGWFWCSGIITSKKAIELIENGYNVSCQYRITDYSENTEGKLHNANPYDKEILDGVFEHLAIVENPRYEDAFIAVNAYIDKDKEFIKWFKKTLFEAVAKEFVARNSEVFLESEHPRGKDGKFTKKGNAEKSSEVYNPSVLIGVKKGKPLNHKQAMNVNPKYFEGEEFRNNCQSCVLAYDLCRRGYDVKAVPYKEDFGKIFELARNPFHGWINPDNKQPCKGTKINAQNPEQCLEWLSNNLKNGERYVFIYGTVREEGFSRDSRHIVCIEKVEKDKIRIADPQNYRERIGEDDIIGFLDVNTDFSGKYSIEILRVDDKEVNPYFVDEVVQGKF